VGSGWRKEPCTRWGLDAPMGRGNFEGERGVPLKSIDTLRSPVRIRLKRSRCRLGCGMGRRNRVLDGGPVVLRDVAMATNFGTKLLLTGCVDDSD